MRKPFLLLCIALTVFITYSCSPSASREVIIPPAKKDTLKVTRLLLLPLGKVPQEYLDTVKAGIEMFYHFKVYQIKAVEIPKAFFVNIKSPRFRADSIIDYLWDIKPDSAKYIMGLTTSDISTTTYENGKIKQPEYKYRDWGIMGLGFCPGPACVISTFRLKGKTESITIDRLIKVILHELGHNIGLPHCPTKGCFMEDANEKVSTVDGETLELCPKCKKWLAEHLNK
jgi:archaemetzincin